MTRTIKVIKFGEVSYVIKIAENATYNDVLKLINSNATSVMTEHGSVINLSEKIKKGVNNFVPLYGKLW